MQQAKTRAIEAYCSSQSKKQPSSTASYSHRAKTSEVDPGGQGGTRSSTTHHHHHKQHSEALDSSRGQGLKSLNGNVKQDEEGNSVMNVSPYITNINSYVKSQNYYKKFFRKQIPMVLHPSQPPSQPFVNQESMHKSKDHQLVNQSQGKPFFKSRMPKGGKSNTQQQQQPHHFQKADLIFQQKRPRVQVDISQTVQQNQKQSEGQPDDGLNTDLQMSQSPKPTRTTKFQQHQQPSQYKGNTSMGLTKAQVNHEYALSTQLMERPKQSNPDSRAHAASVTKAKQRGTHPISPTRGQLFSQDFNMRKQSYRVQSTAGKQEHQQFSNTQRMLQSDLGTTGKTQAISVASLDPDLVSIQNPTELATMQGQNERQQMDQTQQNEIIKTPHNQRYSGNLGQRSSRQSNRVFCKTKGSIDSGSVGSIKQQQQMPPSHEQLTSLASSRKYRNNPPSNLASMSHIASAKAIHSSYNNIERHTAQSMIPNLAVQQPVGGGAQQPLDDLIAVCLRNSSSNELPLLEKPTHVRPVTSIEKKTFGSSQKHTAKQRKRQLLQRSRDQLLSNRISQVTATHDAIPQDPIIQSSNLHQNELLNPADLETRGVVSQEPVQQSISTSRKMSFDSMAVLSYHKKEDRIDETKMDYFIKEFREYQQSSRSKKGSTPADVRAQPQTKLKNLSTSNVALTMSYQQSMQYQAQQQNTTESSNTASKPIMFVPPSPIQPTDNKKNLFSANTGIQTTNATKRFHEKSTPVNGSHYNNKITKTTRAFQNMNNLRKSFDRKRPVWTMYEKIYNGNMPPMVAEQRRTLGIHGHESGQISIVENASQQIQKSRQSGSHHSSAKHGHKPHQMKKNIGKNNSYANLHASQQHQSRAHHNAHHSQQSSGPRAHLASANRNGKQKQQPHVVIKNLIITNANLQNCNVFIQQSNSSNNQQLSAQNAAITNDAYADVNDINSGRQNVTANAKRERRRSPISTKQIKTKMMSQLDFINGTPTQKIGDNYINSQETMNNQGNLLIIDSAQQLLSLSKKQKKSTSRVALNILSEQQQSQQPTFRIGQGALKRAKTAGKGSTASKSDATSQKEDGPGGEDLRAYSPTRVSPPPLIEVNIKQTPAWPLGCGAGGTTVGNSSKLGSQKNSMIERKTELDKAQSITASHPAKYYNNLATSKVNMVIGCQSSKAYNQQSSSGVITPNGSQLRVSQQPRGGKKKETARVATTNGFLAKNQRNSTALPNNSMAKTASSFAPTIATQNSNLQAARRLTKSPSVATVQNQFVFQQQNSGSPVERPKNPNERDLTLNDFRSRTNAPPLGVGHFGKVWLVKQRESTDSIINETIKDEAPYQQTREQKNQATLVTNRSASLSNEVKVKSILPLDSYHSLYALKMVDLQTITKQKQIEHLMNEKEILNRLQTDRDYEPIAANFPKLYSTFKSQMHVNFLMEPIEGITLYEFQRHQVCISMYNVRYYAAKILLLLDYLHQQKIVFRDLKTENIMIDQATGEIRLVDFGFAKDLSRCEKNRGTDRTYTKCGTPGYTAPEVLLQEEGSSMFNIVAGKRIAGCSPQKQISLKNASNSAAMGSENQQRKIISPAVKKSSHSGYSYPADVWSWGVLVCELIGGFNPFQGASVQETFENISRINVNWPKNLDMPSSQMLMAIFQRDAALRPTLQSLKRSSFFESVNWNNLERTFSRAKMDTRDIVQSIMTHEQRMNSKKEESWELLEEALKKVRHGRVSPMKAFQTRRQNTQAQISTIHEALSHF